MMFLIYINVALFFLGLTYLVLGSQLNHLKLNRVLLLVFPVLPVLFYLLTGMSTETTSDSASSFNVLMNEVVISSDAQLSETTGLQGLNVAFIYGLIACFVFLLTMLRVIFTYRKVNSMDYHTNGDHIQVAYTSYPETFSFFNRIHINESLKNRVDVYEHEKAHVDQKHSIDNICFGIYKCLFWINPAIYWLEKQAKLNHEYLADEVALKQSSEDEYLNNLLNIHFGTSSIQFINQFNNQKLLKMRIKRINQSKLNSGIRQYAFMAFAGVAVFFTGNAFTTLNPDSYETVEISDPQEDLDKMPEFKGGQEALIKYMVGQVKYPEAAKNNGVEGKIMVEFIVAKNGAIKDAKVLKSVDENLDKEALRVVKEMPKWNPGEKDGKKVDAKVVLPVMFKLK